MVVADPPVTELVLGRRGWRAWVDICLVSMAGLAACFTSVGLVVVRTDPWNAGLFAFVAGAAAGLVVGALAFGIVLVGSASDGVPKVFRTGSAVSVALLVVSFAVFMTGAPLKVRTRLHEAEMTATAAPILAAYEAHKDSRDGWKLPQPDTLGWLDVQSVGIVSCHAQQARDGDLDYESAVSFYLGTNERDPALVYCPSGRSDDLGDIHHSIEHLSGPWFVSAS